MLCWYQQWNSISSLTPRMNTCWHFRFLQTTGAFQIICRMSHKHHNNISTTRVITLIRTDCHCHCKRWMTFLSLKPKPCRPNCFLTPTSFFFIIYLFFWPEHNQTIIIVMKKKKKGRKLWAAVAQGSRQCLVIWGLLVVTLHGSHRHQYMNVCMKYCWSPWTKASAGMLEM